MVIIRIYKIYGLAGLEGLRQQPSSLKRGDIPKAEERRKRRPPL